MVNDDHELFIIVDYVPDSIFVHESSFSSQIILFFTLMIFYFIALFYHITHKKTK